MENAKIKNAKCEMSNFQTLCKNVKLARFARKFFFEKVDDFPLKQRSRGEGAISHLITINESDIIY